MRTRGTFLVAGLIALLLCAQAFAQPTSYLYSPHQFGPPPSFVGDPKKDDKNGNTNDNGNGDKKDEEVTWYSVHGQATIISQGNWLFRSPYTGTNSFLSKRDM